MKTVKLHKSFRPPASSLLSAKATRIPDEETQRPKDTRPADVRFVKNVSVEEWDCPRPGAKHYLPKSVKENIRKNKRKFQLDMQQQQPLDTLSLR